MQDNLKDFEAFNQIMAKLRSAEGCPWDRKQTHHSLKPYLIEEAYETLQALDDEDSNRLCDELGDLLLQIGLHAQIASESGDFDITDVLQRINHKLIRRHPHVFGGSEVESAEEVAHNWEEIKQEEKGRNKPLLGGIPKDIPALAYTQIVQQRVARVGFDWKEMKGVLAKVTEELGELQQAENHQQKVAEFGDLIFALANAARWMDIDLEAALRHSNQRFSERFAYMENLSLQRSLTLHNLTIEELDALWEEAKTGLAKKSV